MSVELVTVADDVRLEVRRAGSGPTVLLNGGLGQPAAVWEYTGVVDALVEAGFSTVSYCARGIAPSSAPPPPYAVADLARDADALLTALGLDDVLVLGYSMGCYVTQELIRIRPSAVRAAALVAGLQPSPIGELVGRMELGLLDRFGEIPAEVMAFEQLVTTLHPALLTDRAAVTGWLDILSSGGQVWTDDDGMRGQLEASYAWIRAGEPTPRRLAALDPPVLVLAFEHDLFFPPAGCRQAAAAMPDARFAQIDGVGHGGLFTAETDTVARVVTFLGRHR